ncbi:MULTISPECIES: CopG family ribbon-helix-helix protein [Aeromonas]|jgi:predicted transcriptional regulator|uniref:CopG family ribbon-helix-helix protein n=2 Tax=Aeromonadaceae TaxID=84642 RepID=UPI00030F441E|nr:CopG family ribbon-helix-helix protein [Escherichia coli]MBL0443803.1 CopG family ribbon-helix-helix protein [Aeromonas veronii]RDD48339.1 ribbon-helix-helix protein, CopG family [Aeromonas sp. ARM81]
MSAATKPMSIKLDSDTQSRIKQLAAARDRSAHWMMREAITQYVEREERKEAFRRDTLDAWQEFQETGLHVSLDEADQWLAGWGTEIEGGAPACHK